MDTTIDVRKDNVSMYDIYRKVKSGFIRLGDENPSGYFVAALVMRIPTLPITVKESYDATYDVVLGSDRIKEAIEYIDGDYPEKSRVIIEDTRIEILIIKPSSHDQVDFIVETIRRQMR